MAGGLRSGLGGARSAHWGVHAKRALKNSIVLGGKTSVTVKKRFVVSKLFHLRSGK